MKNVIIIVVILFLGIQQNIQAQNKAVDLPMDNNAKYGKLEFVNKIYTFGKIKKGEKITTSFQFKNTGSKPVYILQVQASCGCTAVEWTKGAIKAGEVGEIIVTFDSGQKDDIIGKQTKTLLVISNASNKEEKLMLQGEVEKIAE